ncbi:arabinose transporter [Oryzifoliimicrobium ureilyticus]|uniref:arabinose transporter n=1 Tax=Oryzifoliimicrobium ureilyticus TaxID=3113724 RepID=UPI003075FCEE
MAFRLTDDPKQSQLFLLIGILFISYLCVATALPVVPVFANEKLGLSNGWAGLAVGIAFIGTIFTRAYAGRLVDTKGAKHTVYRGLFLYVAGTCISLWSGIPLLRPAAAFTILVSGRLIIGVGESLVAVGVITWGVSLVGPARSGRVLALVGTAIYGALGLGGPIGLLTFEHLGFEGAMALGAALPLLGLIAIRKLPYTTANSHVHERSPLASVIGPIWGYSLIIFMQGVGFAAIGSFFTLYFFDLGWSNAGLGLSAFGCGFVLVRLLFGHLPDRFGGVAIASVSLAVEALGQILIATAPNPATAFAGAFMTGLGCSMIFPAMGREVVHVVPAALRGTALGAFSAFQDLAYGLTGPLAGLLADRTGYTTVFLIGSAMAATGFFVTLALRKPEAFVPRK